MNRRLIIVCGLLGSGKTTLAKQLEAELSAIRFCPDEWMNALDIDLYDEAMRQRIEKIQWDFAQKVLACDGVAIIEWGTWGRSERDALREGARKLGASVELRYLSASADILFDRIKKRGMEDPPIKKKIVEGWFKVFEEPTSDEIALFDSPGNYEFSI
ncbi:MAG: ATP-binding protein [Deltaproteobacteria bacterium]|nr:ATP-binding protein [Deltaproteobacteria bacterium]